MLVTEFPLQIQGKQIICNIDNQVLKVVWEGKGTSKNLMLNNIGKQIYWLQFLGKFYIYKFTGQSPGLEATLSQHIFNSL